MNYIIPKYRLTRSQDLPKVFSDTGSFYIYDRKALLKLNKKKNMPKKTIHYLIKHKTIDINYPKDLKLAIELFKKKQLKNVYLIIFLNLYYCVIEMNYKT